MNFFFFGPPGHLSLMERILRSVHFEEMTGVQIPEGVSISRLGTPEEQKYYEEHPVTCYHFPYGSDKAIPETFFETAFLPERVAIFFSQKRAGQIAETISDLFSLSLKEREKIPRVHLYFEEKTLVRLQEHPESKSLKPELFDHWIREEFIRSLVAHHLHTAEINEVLKQVNNQPPCFETLCGDFYPERMSEIENFILLAAKRMKSSFASNN